MKITLGILIGMFLSMLISMIIISHAYSGGVGGTFSFNSLTITQSGENTVFQWDYLDDDQIVGFAVFASDDILGFVFELDEAICTSDPYVHTCTGGVECGQYVTVCAYVNDNISQISNIVQVTCD